MRAAHNQPDAFFLSGVEVRFLRTIYRYHMLKPEQLTRRFYSKGSLTLVKAHLKQLTDHGYLDANEQLNLAVDPKTGHGKPRE